MLDAKEYFCFDMGCTYHSSEKLTLYVYISCDTWMKANIKKMFPRKNTENPPGIQISSKKEHLFGHVHNHTADSDCLSNFFFQDWVQ